MSMSKRSQQICIWSGPLGFTLFPLGIWSLAHFLPPLSPAASAADIAAIYSDNTIGIRLGAMVMMFAAALFAPFFAMISVMIKRIEGPVAPYALTQIITATLAVTCFFLSPMLFTVAAFRPERVPELTQLMNDFAWIMFVTPAAPAFVQTLAIGLAILSDRSAVPILPRWSGYYSLWVAVLFLPGALAMMFKTGPFAWNGLLAFWVPAVLVGQWSCVMAVLMVRAVRRQA